MRVLRRVLWKSLHVAVSLPERQGIGCICQDRWSWYMACQHSSNVPQNILATWLSRSDMNEKSTHQWLGPLQKCLAGSLFLTFTLGRGIWSFGMTSKMKYEDNPWFLVPLSYPNLPKYLLIFPLHWGSTPFNLHQKTASAVKVSVLVGISGTFSLHNAGFLIPH